MNYKYNLETHSLIQQPEMNDPNSHFGYGAIKVDEAGFDKYHKQYNEHIASLKTYDVPQEFWEKWEDGQPLEEGVDFYLGDLFNPKELPVNPKRAVAIAINKEVEEEKEVDKWGKPEDDFLVKLRNLVTATYGNKLLFYKFIDYFNNSSECGGDKFNDDIEEFINLQSQLNRTEK